MALAGLSIVHPSGILDRALSLCQTHCDTELKDDRNMRERFEGALSRRSSSVRNPIVGPAIAQLAQVSEN